MQQSELITVGRAYGQAEAALAVALLNASGIQVFAQSWHMGSMTWHWSHAIGGVELRVPASQALSASELLTGFPMPPRPKSLLRRSIIALVGLGVLLAVSLPPPASGLFAVALRPVAPRAAQPSANRS